MGYTAEYKITCDNKARKCRESIQAGNGEVEGGEDEFFQHAEEAGWYWSWDDHAVKGWLCPSCAP